MPQPDNTIHWDSLSAGEILSLLCQDPERAGLAAVSGFLDVHQWLPLSGEAGLRIAGGFPGAQFRRATCGKEPPGIEFVNLPLSALPVNARSARGARSHLERLLPPAALGDFVAGSHIAVCATTESLDQLQAQGGTVLESWSPPTTAIQQLSIASCRLDVVASAVFRVSRAESGIAIEQGFVYCNFKQVTKKSTLVSSGDCIVYRTLGRAEIGEILPNERSGRFRIQVLSFPV